VQTVGYKITNSTLYKGKAIPLQV